jgi:MoxR-like ATPase
MENSTKMPDQKNDYPALSSIEEVQENLERNLYIPDRSLATVIYLAHAMKRPIFLEGEPGVGKTEVGVVLAKILKTKLIRLQCYEGLDANTALYEWNYPKQLLRIKLEEKGERSKEEIGHMIFSEEYLIKRPLLDAISSSDDRPSVLLIDELDRTDEAFEAFLLEVLSDFQISIPEIGTIKATQIPTVVVTSNRTRDIHDALKRRCLYHWIDYPSFEKEYRILQARLPGTDKHLAGQVTNFMQCLRNENFLKKPGISETLDWGEALIHLHKDQLNEETVVQTLGCILKYHEDIVKFNSEIWSDQEKRKRFLGIPHGLPFGSD